jgi:hypothetical protein
MQVCHEPSQATEIRVRFPSTGRSPAAAPHVLQPCPTCGRRLRVRIEHLGLEVVCRHCLSRFTAADPAHTPRNTASARTLMQRVDQLLAMSDSG